METIELNEKQLERLYLFIELKDYIQIVKATIGKEKYGFLTIEYIDKRNGVRGIFKPYFSKYSQDDKIKIDIILEGFRHRS